MDDKFKIIKSCPLCGSNKKSKVILNNKNIYSYFFSKILNLEENFVLNYMLNYKCSHCELIYKKKWVKSKFVKEIYTKYQTIHHEGLNTLKKNFGKKKFQELIKEYLKLSKIKEKDVCDRKIREIVKILNFTENKNKEFIKLKSKFISKLKKYNVLFIKSNYLKLSNFVIKPKIYSQFSGFKSDEIANYLNKNINLKNIKSYAEIGCPLWGNYSYFSKPWIKKFFLEIDEINFWKSNKKFEDSCLKHLHKSIKIIKNKSKQINFIGIYNYLDHLEKPLKLFKKKLQYSDYYGIICEDIKLSKKIDCQHFSSWNYKSIKFLAEQIGYIVLKKPLRLGNSIFKLYLLKKINYKHLNKNF